MTLKLLYVDDEPDIREVALLCLEMDPEMEVRSAGGPREALAMLDAGDWAPDALLLDVMMPEMDGPGLLREIRTRPRFAGTPAIFITARAQPAEQQRFLDAGAVGVVSKPFDPMTLAQDVRKALGA